MNFYRLIDHTPFYKYGDNRDELPILNNSYGSWQRSEFQNAGITVVDINSQKEIKEKEFVIIRENTLITSYALLKVIKKVKQGSPFKLTLPNNSFNKRFSLPISDGQDKSPYLEFHINGENGDEWELPQDVFQDEINLPLSLVKEKTYSVGVCREFVCRLETPFHLLFANAALNLNRGYKLRKNFPKFVEKLFPVFSRGYYWGLKRINKIGRNCRIHPTAVLEGVELGDNVIVGAYAIVRLSVIGRNTIIEDQASVVHSVIGSDNFIANKNHVAFCFTYPEVFLIHGPYQYSIFGRHTAVFATINCDTRMDKENIKIPTPNGIIDSHQAILGIAYGHHCKVAGGNIIAPGRIVPNNTTLLPPGFIHDKFKESV